MSSTNRINESCANCISASFIVLTDGNINYRKIKLNNNNMKSIEIQKIYWGVGCCPMFSFFHERLISTLISKVDGLRVIADDSYMTTFMLNEHVITMEYKTNKIHHYTDFIFTLKN